MKTGQGLQAVRRGVRSPRRDTLDFDTLNGHLGYLLRRLQLLVFKDDGPSITASAVGAPTLTVDESILATNASGNCSKRWRPEFRFASVIKVDAKNACAASIHSADGMP